MMLVSFERLFVVEEEGDDAETEGKPHNEHCGYFLPKNQDVSVVIFQGFLHIETEDLIQVEEGYSSSYLSV